MSEISGIAGILEKKAADLSDRFQREIHEELRRHWIGRGNPERLPPCSTYEPRYLKILGETPILITAPHAVPHDRGKEKLKEQDDNTDLVAMEICRLVDGYGLIPLNPLADPNRLHREKRPDQSPAWESTKEVSFYLEAEKMVREEGIRLVIDIHGIRDHHHDSVVIGKSGSKGREDWAEGLKRYFDQNGIRASIDVTETKDGRKRNLRGGDFVRNIPVPALQLELKPELRFGEGLHSFCRLFASFLLARISEGHPGKSLSI
ncbi:MAG: hypothetical protein HXY45_08325 [Syntrophaceae bacterium]|nr:hypothetical protein [Syntrophaceae bacterium]